MNRTLCGTQWKSDILSPLFALGVPTTLSDLGAFCLFSEAFTAKKIASSIFIEAVASCADYKKDCQ